MELQAVFLLIIAAFLHSSWNIMTKNSLNKQVFLWLSLWSSSIIYAAPFIYRFEDISFQGLVYIVISGILETFYIIILGKAYNNGEISQLYPIARGCSPLFVIVFATIFLGERITLIGFGGICMILVGINLIIFRSVLPRNFNLITPSLKGVVYALLTAVTIAGYSIVDKKGISLVDPFIYIYLVFLFAAILLTPLIVLRRPAIIAEINNGKLSILFVGLVQLFAYLLVLFAMTNSKVSYISAVREISVIITPILSALFLKEILTLAKIIGAVTVFGGILLVTMAK